MKKCNLKENFIIEEFIELEEQTKQIIFLFSKIKNESLRKEILLFFDKIDKIKNGTDIFKIINNIKSEDLKYIQKFARYINKNNSPAMKDKIIDLVKTFSI